MLVYRSVEEEGERVCVCDKDRGVRIASCIQLRIPLHTIVRLYYVNDTNKQLNSSQTTPSIA